MTITTGIHIMEYKETKDYLFEYLSSNITLSELIDKVRTDTINQLIDMYIDEKLTMKEVYKLRDKK